MRNGPHCREQFKGPPPSENEDCPRFRAHTVLAVGPLVREVKPFSGPEQLCLGLQAFFMRD